MRLLLPSSKNMPWVRLWPCILVNRWGN
jgi:hypothetical protein